MRNVWKKCRIVLMLSMIVLVVAFFCLVPGMKTAKADDVTVGTWGDNITWTLDADGLLTISGEGAMKASSSTYSEMPFYAYRDSIVSVVIEDGITNVCSYAFLQCTKLTSVSLPETLTSIDLFAFNACTSLTQIVIPDSVVTIDGYAFYGDTALSSVVFSENLTYIGDKAFYGCSSLTEVVLPNSMTEIASGAFWNCTSLYDIQLSNAITYIPELCFYGCKALTTIDIPATVTLIGEQAFMKSGISKITIPGTVEEIGDYAFADCTSLTDLVIEEGVQYAGDLAFRGCTSLSEISLPDSLIHLGANVFLNTAFYNTAKEDVIILNNGVLYKYKGTDSSLTIPDTVVAIAGKAFYENTTLETVILPDNLQIIEAYAFYNCSTLTEVKGSSMLTYIGEYAFYDCSLLENIEIPDTIEFVGSYALYGTAYLENNSGKTLIFGSVLYYYNGDDTRVEIPEGITTISDEAFVNNYLLEEVVLPESLVSIGSYAFLDCHSLTSIYVPDGVIEIGEYAIGIYRPCGLSENYQVQSAMVIYGVSDSAAETYADTYGVGFSVYEEEDLISGTCGENITWSLNVASGVLTLSGTGKTTVYSGTQYNHAPFWDYNDLITSIVVEEGVRMLAGKIFYDLSNVESVSLPSTLYAIDSYAFGNCTSLKTITLPASLNSYIITMFDGCTSLEAIYVEEGSMYLTSIDGVLYDKNVTWLVCYPQNSPIEVFELPETVTSLGSTLGSANNLRCVVLPETLTGISNTAFKNLKMLEKVIFLGDAPYSGDSYSDLYFMHDVMVVGNLSQDDWKELIEASSYGHIRWEDMSAYSTETTLDIGRDSETISAGNTMQLSAQIAPSQAVLFTWSSSDETVARVSWTGLVTAVSAGTTVITCKSENGNYSASFTLTVTGKSESDLPDYSYTTLDADMVGVPYTSLQIPCETLNGIYFLNDGLLFFYSLSDGTCEEIRNFNLCISAYESNEILYIFTSIYQLEVYDLVQQKLLYTMYVEDGYRAMAVGADTEGRIYISAYAEENNIDNRIFMYSAEGELLSTLGYEARVYEFLGFDEERGYFFVESLTAHRESRSIITARGVTYGRVQDNKLESIYVGHYYYYRQSPTVIVGVPMPCIMFTTGDYKYCHQGGAAVLGGHYLVVRSTYWNRFLVVDYSEMEFTESSMSLERTTMESDTSDQSSATDTTSVGVRAVYYEANDSIIMYDNDKKIVEYNPSTGEAVASFETQHYVYSLSWVEDYLVIVEKEEELYYLEIVRWSEVEGISISGTTHTMEVGESTKLTVESDTRYTLTCEWNSSDDQIASVTESGRVVAWREGTVTITASVLEGKYTADYTITVTAKDVNAPQISIVKMSGEVSDNISDNNYTVWSDTVKSYLTENDDGTLMRVEYLGETGVLVEIYSAEHVLQSSKVISMELPIFGGFYEGEDSYFLVFGQSNTGENDSVEVMRVVKYDKSWNRISDCSIYGANTYIPFASGTVRMAETDGCLYIYTCHEMYDTGDGYHHQANMTFIIDESSMTVTDSYYEIMNIADTGYVSHSFNQFIQSDGECVYRVDHGDANPRAVTITKAMVDGSITEVTYTYVLSILGESGDNATGVSVGGFEVSSDKLLIVGNSVDQSDSSTYSASGQRNIFLTVTDKDLESTTGYWLTDYTSSDGITPRTPQLIKLTEDHFLIMWEEYNSSTGKLYVKAVTVDGDGTITSEIVKLSVRLSDCQPIVTSDGLVTWYVTDGSTLTMYTLNPYGLDVSKIYLEDTDIYVIRTDNENGNVDASTVEELAAGRSTEQLIFSKTTSFDRSLELVLGEIEETLGVTIEGDKALLLQKDSDGSLALIDQAMIANNTVTFSVTVGADSVVVYGYNGDVTGDGAVNASDTLAILRGVSGRTSLDEVEKGFADVNLDGTVNSNDLLAVVKYVSGRTSTLN